MTPTNTTVDPFEVAARRLAGDSAHPWLATPTLLAQHLSAESDEPFLAARHLDKIDELFLRADAGERVKALIMEPPQHGKTTAVKYGLLWYLRRNLTHRAIFGTYNATKARKEGRWIRNLIRASADPRNVDVPDIGLKLAPDQGRADEWELTTGGGLLAVGRGGSATGNKAHIIVVDDPLKGKAEADSEAIRESADQWIRQDLMTRQRPICSVFIIQTRWDIDDPVGRRIKEDPDGWEIIELPAIARERDLLGRQPGDLLWPEVYDARFYADQRVALRVRGFEALYQQNPQPLEGVIFKAAPIERWRVHQREDGTYFWPNPDTGQPEPFRMPDWQTVREYVDPSFAEADSEEADETGRLVLAKGLDPRDGRTKVFCLADLSERSPFDGLRDSRKVGDTWRTHGTTTVKAERNLLGNRVVKTIARGLPSHVSVVPIDAKGTKQARAESAAALNDNGLLVMVGEFPELETQMLTWKPTDTDSPDRMDTMVHGLLDLLASDPADAAGAAKVGIPSARLPRIPGLR